MFEQAKIAVENQKVFGELKGAIDAAFAAEKVERFLRSLEKKKLRARDVEGVLEKKLLDGVDAAGLYKTLSVSDQAQIREHYLSRVEQVPLETREKFRRLYSYY